MCYGLCCANLLMKKQKTFTILAQRKHHTSMADTVTNTPMHVKLLHLNPNSILDQLFTHKCGLKSQDQYRPYGIESGFAGSSKTKYQCYSLNDLISHTN